MTDTDEFTRLADPVLDEVHGVKGAANGTPFLVAKSEAADSAQGLFALEVVQDAIAKAEADAAANEPSPVTVTGTPAAVADMMARIHRAPVRKADMSTADINDLPDSAFAYIEPGGEKDADGKTTPRSKRHFPVHDEAHTRNALSRAPQSPFGEKAMPKIKAAAKKFDIEVAKAAGDADPGSPTWESQDAASAKAAIDQILACIPAVDALAQREGAEVGAGHGEDICDVWDLQSVTDSLTYAAKTLAGFALAEQIEAGETVAKAQQPAAPAPAATEAASPKENTVDTTTTEVAKAEDAAAAGTGTAQAQPVSKAAALAELLGVSMEKLAELGAQSVLKAAAEPAATQTTDASPAPADTARVIPGTSTVQAPAAAATDDVSKAAATDIASAVAAVLAPVVKQLGELATQVNAQGERVEKMGLTPDTRRSPVLNGATGNASPAVRDHSGSPINSPEMQAVLKAVDELPKGPARDEARKRVTKAAIEARLGLV